MFGRDDTKSTQDNQIPAQSIDAALGGDAQLPAPIIPAADPVDTSWQHPGSPLNASPIPTTVAPQPVNVANDDEAPTEDFDSSELLDIKQQALTQLSPLVSHLEQSPEEKFRTLMMMIQASDDQSKIKDAYAAAQAIPDEKIRAQALLDVVNEINYFTQHHES